MFRGLNGSLASPPALLLSRPSLCLWCFSKRFKTFNPDLSMTTHTLARRTFLRGVGVTMALPWMESLPVWGDEPHATKPASEAPVRLAVLFAGNGFHSK